MDRTPLVKKYTAIGIILLFVAIAYAPAIAQTTEKQSVSRGTWLYVGGSGPGNYSRIQDAIDHASWFDTVFVYNGTYNEKITIDKSLCLLGESRNKTIITNNSIFNTLISLSSSNITISGFTLNLSSFPYQTFIISSVQNEHNRDIIISDNIFQANTSGGIFLYHCDFCSITYNILYTDVTAISLTDSQHCIITDNTIISSKGCFGIFLSDHSSFTIISNNTIEGGSPFGLGVLLTEGSNNNIVSNNCLFNNNRAIYIHESSYIVIFSNYIHNSLTLSNPPFGWMGIQIIDGGEFVIHRNYISRFEFGIFLEDVYEINVSMNTFIKNIVHARFFDLGKYSNTWNQNYWGRPRILPKPIFGLNSLYAIYPGFVVFDWHPAQEPYDI